LDRQFWLARWQENRVGFHLNEVNAHLETFWPQLGISGGRVLVPLCGKSLDMLWLRSQGHEVLGVEISPVAVRDFFAENRLHPERREHGAFELWFADGVSILVGDFFDLTEDDVAGVGCVYDRASLVALPPSMRRVYADCVESLLPSRVPILLVTLEYDETQMDGPPFSVFEPEVRSYYGATRELRLLLDHDALAESPGLAEKGVTRMREKVYHLSPPPANG